MTHCCIFDSNKIAKWKKFCVENEISHEETLKIANRTALPVGDRPDYILYLDDGYRFVYSIDTMISLSGTCTYKIRKLSGSVTRSGMYPSVAVMKEIMHRLDFKGLGECKIIINDHDPIPNIEIHDVISIKKIES